MADAASAFRTLGKSDDVPAGYVMPYYLDREKRRVSVARIGGRLFAFDDLSPSDGSPLSSGLLTGTVIMSPCDGSQFDVATGAVVRGPATQALRTFEVREQGGEIQVKVA